MKPKLEDKRISDAPHIVSSNTFASAWLHGRASPAATAPLDEAQFSDRRLRAPRRFDDLF